MTRTLIFAFISSLGIALRPSLSDSDAEVSNQAVSAAVANLSALSQTNRSSAANSLAVLETASSILSSISSLEPPPSLTPDTIQALSDVITLIQDVMYQEMDAGHDADVAALASAAAAVSACNAALQSTVATGTIHHSKGRAIDKHNHYEDALEDFEQKEDHKNTQEAAFNAHMGSIVESPTCVAYPGGHSEDRWVDYFNIPPDIATFEQQKAVFEEKQAAYHQAVADMDASNLLLAGSKGALEDAYCNMLVLMRIACIELDACHAAAWWQFEAVKAQAENNMVLRKHAYEQGEGITEHLRSLLGLDEPENPTERTYDLEIPVPASPDACSVETMEGERTWEDFLQVSTCDLPARGDAPGMAACPASNPYRSEFAADCTHPSCPGGWQGPCCDANPDRLCDSWCAAGRNDCAWYEAAAAPPPQAAGSVHLGLYYPGLRVEKETVQPGAGDFTILAKVRPNSMTYGMIASVDRDVNRAWAPASVRLPFRLEVYSSGIVGFVTVSTPADPGRAWGTRNGWGGRLHTEGTLAVGENSTVAVTRAGSTFKLFLNSEVQTFEADSITVLSKAGDGETFRIGSQAPGVSTPFQGDIMEALYFDRALSVTDIHALSGLKACGAVDISTLHKDLPNPSSTAIDFNGDVMSISGSGSLDLWGGRGDTPIAWMEAPASEEWTFEVDIRLITADRTITLMSVYDGPDGDHHLPFHFGPRTWSGHGIGAEIVLRGGNVNQGHDSGEGKNVFIWHRCRIVRRPGPVYDFSFRGVDDSEWITYHNGFELADRAHANNAQVVGTRLALGLKHHSGHSEIEFKNLVVHSGAPDSCT